MHFNVRGNQKPPAIVIGIDSLNGIQTVRVIARYGIPVIGIAKDREHYGCWTRLCQKILFTDTASESLVETLEALGPQLDQKAVIFPNADMNVLMVSRYRERLSNWYHIVLPPPEVVEMLMNKTRFYTFAQQNGFPLPPTRFLNNWTEAKSAADEMAFPCIIKPPMSAAPTWEKNSKLKAYKVSTPTEFLDVYERSLAWTDELIAQEWIPGPDSNHYSCECYFNAQSELLVTFVSQKLRQWPPIIGESTLGMERRNDIVLQTAIDLFRRVKLQGPGSLEMKMDQRSGEYFIIEPNTGRATARSHMAEAGGVEFFYTMYCDSLGWDLPEKRQQTYQGVKWISLRRDLQSALFHRRNGDLTLKDWWQSLRGLKGDAVFSLDDPGPFLGDIYRSIRLYLIPEERRKRDFRNL